MSFSLSKTFTDLYDLEKVKIIYNNFDRINLGFDENNVKKCREAQKKYLKQLIDPKPVTYRYASGKKSGRLYGSPLQFLKKELRNAICKDYYTDIDMKNAQPKILLWWCEKKGMNVKVLKEYCDNRDTYYHLKDEINKIINGGAVGNLKNENDYIFLEKIKNEIEIVHQNMMDNIENKFILNGLKKTSKDNLGGRLCHTILESKESEILDASIKFLDEQIDVSNIVLFFDGLFLPSEHFKPELLGELNEYIFKQITIPVEYIKKEMKDPFIVPDDWVSFEKEKQNKEKEKEILAKQRYEKYLLQKKEFEKKFQKIIGAGLFVHFENNDINYFSEHKLKVDYKHLLGGKFIDIWITDPYMKTYDNLGVHPKNCPENTFNLWLPFDAELNENIGDDPDAVETFKFHISVLCNHEPEITNLLINWLGQMLQYPETKTFIPTFISKQGAGKGTLLEIMTKILGAKRVFDTATPTQYVWGDFNGAMEQAFLVCLNEMSKKEMGECDGRFKKLITDPTIRINKKGIESFEIQSFHRFMICSNNDDPVKTSEDDRRNIIIKCSDELCDKEKNKDYWIKMRKLINNGNAIKTIYNHLTTLPDLEHFHLTKLPKTEYHKDILDKNEPVELSFAKSLALESNTLETKTYKADEIITKFNDFIKTIGKKEYNIDAPTLLLRLKNLNIKGLTKKSTKVCNLTQIDFKELKMHFNIKCHIEKEYETEIYF